MIRLTSFDFQGLQPVKRQPSPRPIRSKKAAGDSRYTKEEIDVSGFLVAQCSYCGPGIHLLVGAAQLAGESENSSE